MNPAKLLTHLERMSEAPGAIHRLRGFILDLAVQGKLVEQDPSDESASDLLKRIQEEKARLMEEGKIKKQQALPQIGPDEAPFDIPEKWEWARLGEIGLTQTGTTPSKNHGDHFGSHIPFIKPGDLYPNNVDYTNEGLSEIGLKESGRLAPTGSLLMVCIGTIGKCQLIDRDCSFNQQINSLSPYGRVCSRFLLAAFLSEYLQKSAWAASARTTIAILNKGKWELLMLPLAPLAEQHRIVAKVDELMALCDRLEAAQAERESRREHLTAASLHRLNNGGPADEFREHARFYFNHLPRLTTRIEHIQQLRRTILNLAVQGKLVPQDPIDEAASLLLLKIEAEKLRLAKEGKIKKPNVRLSGERSGAPHELPAGWEWVKLGELCHFENGDRSRNYPSGSDIKSEGVPFVNTKNIVQHRVRFDDLDFITEEKFKSLRSGILMDSDILIVLRGSVGKFGLFKASDRYKTGFINAQLLILRNYDLRVMDYCMVYLMSGIFQDLAFKHSTGSAQPQLAAGNLSTVRVPLPPLAEQQRIVAKVDELVTVCDQLEAQVTTKQTESRRFLEALLHEALAPAT
jgi:type I restriction enzyme, S subunit